MRHKKKRSAPAHSATRSPERLDYSDGAPLESADYQEAIRAHLNEFQDTTYLQTRRPNGTDSIQDHESLASSNMMSSERHRPPPVSNKSAAKNVPRNGASSATNKERIWNTTTYEERDRIKDFWLNLGEEERKSLVKVEKEAVLRKMKEQNKHSCSCSVCGRKRTAIEDELEVLYDAYYEELEQYANQQQFPSQTSFSSSRQHGSRVPRHSKITEVINSDDSEGSYDPEDELSDGDLLTEDDLSDEDGGDEPFSDEDFGDESAPSEFFKFGNSLTVKGGILTVADDLLKNDGKKFIEMMEQLAERRLQREEEAAMEAREYDEAGDNDDDYDDDIDSEGYDDDEDEHDAMTEEQRMVEGRRMFQIFAARMFEQRVLTAYREKVAQERQAQLLQELEMEDSREKEREAKKAKEKEKKKDKKRQQQLKRDEEKARKEAERLAEEAAAKAEEEKKAEEARKRKEEQRLKREAEKKALEAEKLRKEEEKRKRLAEEKAKETKRLEQAAKEKKAREEASRKEREAKELAAKEAKAKSQAAKAQKEAEAAKFESSKAPTQPPSAPTTASAQTVPRKISPSSQNNHNINGLSIASPAVPRAQGQRDMLHAQNGSRNLQESSAQSASPHNIPPPSSHQHRTLTPGAISPQPYNSHQNSFSRSALGHPPSMPIPLPPPGIGSNNANMSPHDPFGFNSPQAQHSTHAQNGINNRPNNHSSNHPVMSGPPGVFTSVPNLKTPTSPQSRIGTPQAARFNGGAPFNPFNGLSAASTPRDEVVHHDPEMIFPRRTSHLMDGNAMGPVGAIGRPSPARTISAIPAPIQRPSTIATNRNTNIGSVEVLGSRALLDDDDAIVDEKASLKWTNSQNGLGSAALSGGTMDNAYPPQRTTYAFNPPISSFAPPPATTTSDRWGAVGNKSKTSQDEDRFPAPSKPVDWGF